MFVDIALNCVAGNVSSSRYEKQSSPHRRHTSQGWVFFSQHLGAVTFQPEHRIAGRQRWRTIQKQMHVIGHNLQCKDFAAKLDRLLAYQLPGVFLNCSGQHFPAPRGTKNKMIINQENNCVGASIRLTHLHNLIASLTSASILSVQAFWLQTAPAPSWHNRPVV